MLIAIFGESCTGKSTLALQLKEALQADIYSGKDYLRLAKNETIAKNHFRKKLAEAVSGENLIYVIAEKEHLELLPQGAIRILVTAELDVIRERFARRTGGILPPPLSAMLERKHGCFDALPNDYHMISGETDPAALCAAILSRN